MNLFKKSDDRIVYLSVILVLILMLFKTCGSLGTYQQELEYVKSSLDGYKQKTLKDSSKIYSQGLRIATLSMLEDSLKREIKKMGLKKPEVIVKTKIETVYKTEIPLGVDIIDDEPVIKLPKYFYKKDKWFVIGGVINRLGTLQIDSIETTANFTYAIADTSRKGFFNRIAGRKDKVLSMRVDNPHMRITGMSNVVIRDKKMWWQTTGAKIGLGFILGLGVVAAVN